MSNSAFSLPSSVVGSYQLIATATASSSASVSFTGLSSTYFAYEIIADGIFVSTTSAALYGQFSTNNGSSYDGSSIYSHQLIENTGATITPLSSTAQSQLMFLNTGVVTTTIGLSMSLRIFNPSGSQSAKMVESNVNTYSFFNTFGTSYYTNSTAVNAMQIYASTGNITAGTFKLYGISA